MQVHPARLVALTVLVLTASAQAQTLPQDGVPDVLLGAGPGSGLVRLISGADLRELGRTYPFGADFEGGVRVAAGDVTGDGVVDFILAQADNGGQVQVLNGLSGAEVLSAAPFGPDYRGGVFVAAGDLDGDGRADVVVGQAEGGLARAYSGATLTELGSGYPFGPAYVGGVSVAVGDVSGDGQADVITGTALGGLVRIFEGTTFVELGSGFPFGPLFLGGIHVAAGDVTGDGLAEIAIAPRRGGDSVLVADLADLSQIRMTTLRPEVGTGGIDAAVGDVDGDGRADLLFGAGPGGVPQVRLLRGADGRELASGYAFAADFRGGVHVATAASATNVRFTSANATTFAVGSAGTFEITTTGHPPAALTRAGAALPGGVTFTDSGRGTAVLAGTPAAGSAGSYVFNITANNGVSADVVQTFTLTVTDAPRFTSAAAATFVVGQPGTFAVTTAGSPRPTITRTGAALPAGLTWVDNGDGTGTLGGTVAAGTPAGTTTFTFTADNGAPPAATQSFALAVTPVNDAPSFTTGGNPASGEDAGPQSTPNWATAISAGPPDEAGQALTFIVTASTNPALFSVQPAVSSIGTLTYTAAPNTFGSADITVVLRDNGGTANGGVDTSAPQTFTITVLAVDDPPTAVGDAYTVEEADTVSVVAPGVLGNDADPDTPIAGLITTLVAGPANADFFTLNPNGSFTYVHDGSETSSDSFTYRMSDGTTDSDVVTVSLTITAVEDPLETEPNDAVETATVLTDAAARITGNIYPAGDVDYYAFTAQVGDRVYAATMTSASSNASVDSVLDLLASDGSTVLESDADDGTLGATASSIAGATVPASGTYYLRVRHNGAITQLRPYDLWVRVRSGAPTAESEPNDVSPGQTLPASGWVGGELTSTADVDYYAVTLNAGDTVFLSLDLDPERDGEWNGRLGLGPFGSPGIDLVINDAGTATPDSEAFFATVKDAGTYHVVVGAATGSSTFGTYQLSVSVRPAATPAGTTYTSPVVPVTIPDGPPSLVTSTLVIPDDIRIGQLRVAVDLTHNFMADLDVTLTAPDGNTVALFTDVGSVTVASQTRMNMMLDDNAAIPIGQFVVVSGLVFRPELQTRLEWFKGQQAQGTWTLTIRDDATADGGTLNGWSLIVVEDDALPTGTPRTIFSTDFESDDGGFTHSGTQDEWEWGAPTAAPIATANSGVNAWKTDLDNSYNAISSQDLVSPEIDLTGVTTGALLLEWAMTFQMEAAQFDRAFVDIQEVGGAGRTRKLWEWYGADMVQNIGNPVITIQEAAGWGRYRARVDDFFGSRIRLRIHLDTDNSVQRGGLAIDDVSVTVFDPLPASVSLPTAQ